MFGAYYVAIAVIELMLATRPHATLSRRVPSQPWEKSCIHHQRAALSCALSSELTQPQSWLSLQHRLWWDREKQLALVRLWSGSVCLPVSTTSELNVAHLWIRLLPWLLSLKFGFCSDCIPSAVRRCSQLLSSSFGVPSSSLAYLTSCWAQKS